MQRALIKAQVYYHLQQTQPVHLPDQWSPASLLSFIEGSSIVGRTERQRVPAIHYQ